MSKIRRKIYKIIPQFIKDRFDFINTDINNFMIFASIQLEPDSKILDVGAGECPYRHFFNHVKYESIDIKNNKSKSHTFICDMNNIPKPDNHYDAIINTYTLEHVKYPFKVIKEFNRILKPDGRLFLTAPLTYGVHGHPENYYNFTYYGLKSMFKDAGFYIVFIKPCGGIFNDIGKRIKILPYYILNQQQSKIIKILAFPLYIASIPICEFIIPIICFYLDKIDKKRDFTLGYKCYCIKKKTKKR